jgi:hypothetical protein
MARAKRQIIAVNDNDSLRNVLQEVYNKDSAIKTKLDIGKLQSDIIKHSGDVVTAITNNSEIVSKDSFARVREMVEESKQSREVK